jgi:hypothetical protein
MSAHASARGRWALLAVVLAVVGIGVAVMVLRPQLADAVMPDSRRTAHGVTLPEPAQDAAMNAYLKGKGARLLAYSRAVPTSLAGSEKDSCAGLTRELTRVGAPPRLADSGAAAPTPSIRDAAATSLDRVALYVGQCQRGQVDAQVRRDAEFASIVLRRMLSRGAGATS